MSNSNILHKVASAAVAAGLVAAAPVVGSLTLAPAAEAAATAAVGVNFTGTASAATATFTSALSTDAVVYIRVTRQDGGIASSTPVTIKAGTMANPTTTIAAVTVPYLATASVVDIAGNTQFWGPGSIYTNTTPDSLPFYQARKPVQVGNVITVPTAQAGVTYVVTGGAGKALVPGQQITLVPGQTLTIAAVPTNPPLVTLTGPTSWPFTGVQEGPAQMTPAPVLLVSANLYTVPSVSGYHYEVGGKVIPAGNFYVPVGGATIVAVSDNPATLQLVGKTSWELAYVTPPKPDEGTKKVLVCHLDGKSGKYSAVTVAVASLKDGHGHAGHEGDIYPEFSYRGGDDYIVTIPAKNWATGKAIYEANCTVETPAPPSGDTGDHGGDTGGDHGTDHGGTTGGGTTGNTGGTTSSSGSTTNTTSSSSVNVTVQQPQQAPVANQAPVAAPAPATSSGPVVMRGATAADPADASNLGVAGGMVLVVMGGVGAAMLFRRPKHQA